MGRDQRWYRKQITQKNLICITHGHELSGGNAGGRGVAEQIGIKGRNHGKIIII